MMRTTTCRERHDERDGPAVVPEIPGCRCTIEAADDGRSHDADGEVHCMEVQHQLLRQILRECVDVGQADVPDVECPLHTSGGWVGHQNRGGIFKKQNRRRLAF